VTDVDLIALMPSLIGILLQTTSPSRQDKLHPMLDSTPPSVGSKQNIKIISCDTSYRCSRHISNIGKRAKKTLQRHCPFNLLVDNIAADGATELER